MKLFLLFLITILVVGCTAPVKLSVFATEEAANYDADMCKIPEQYSQIKVLSLPPKEGTFIELGTIMTEQSSSSEFVTTSESKQIKKAQQQACIWGADAIMVLQTSSDKGMKYGFFTGLTQKNEKNLRLVAIRYIKN